MSLKVLSGKAIAAMSTQAGEHKPFVFGYGKKGKQLWKKRMPSEKDIAIATTVKTEHGQTIKDKWGMWR